VKGKAPTVCCLDNDGAPGIFFHHDLIEGNGPAVPGLRIMIVCKQINRVIGKLGIFFAHAKHGNIGFSRAIELNQGLFGHEERSSVPGRPGILFHEAPRKTESGVIVP
jgi:hypothetical protein